MGFEPTGLSTSCFQDRCIKPLCHLSMVPKVGVEPTTNHLKGDCSAIELFRRKKDEARRHESIALANTTSRSVVVEQRGIEPRILDCKTSVFPLALLPHVFVDNKMHFIIHKYCCYTQTLHKV